MAAIPNTSGIHSDSLVVLLEEEYEPWQYITDIAGDTSEIHHPEYPQYIDRGVNMCKQFRTVIDFIPMGGFMREGVKPHVGGRGWENKSRNRSLCLLEPKMAADESSGP